MSESTNNTIYDRAFRAIIEKMPGLLIPVINEVFGTNYDMHEKVTTLRNEHQKRTGEVITDSCLLVADHLYHIECQSNPDSKMEIRMIEYDFLIALENAKRTKEGYIMKMPRSCTLYLRHTKNTPDFLTVHLIIPDIKNPSKMQDVVYQTPIVKIQEYSKEKIFEKDLLAFLPYYILRYEKQFNSINENTDALKCFLEEYESIRTLLDQECVDDRDTIYFDLIGLIVQISDYILESHDAMKKGVSEVMGSERLKLKSEQLRTEERIKILVSLVKDNTITLEIAAKKAEMDVEEFKKVVNE